MHENLLADIGKCIVAAAVLSLPAHFFGFPLMLAYLIAGVLLGPHLGFSLVESAQSISTLAEIGLVLLMFILGLEIDLRKLLHAGKAVVINGITQFVFSAFLAYFFFWCLQFGEQYGQYSLLYLAVACSLSSTLMVVKILSDKMELDTLTSRITLGILVFQDLWAIAFLALQPNLANLELAGLAFSAGKVLGLVTFSVVFAKYILPPILLRIGTQPEMVLVVGMAWCFGMAGFANELHLSKEMGALIAGVSIASFPYQTDLAAKITSLRDFFVTLFFVALGLQIPSPTSAVISLSSAIIAFVLLSRIITIFPVLHWMKYGNRTSLLPAINLSQLSEFALVLAAIGVQYKHVSVELLYAIIISMVFTALVSSGLIPLGHKIYRLLNPTLEFIGFRDELIEKSKSETESNELEHPQVVLLGFYREASSLLHEMNNRYSKSVMDRVLVVDLNPEAHHKLKEMGIRCKYGDISHIETLRHLHLDRTGLLVCTIPDHSLKGTTNLLLLKNLKTLAPNAHVIVTAERIDLAVEMYREGADYVFLTRLISAHYLADVLERMQSDGSSSIKAGGLAHLEGRKEIIS